MKVAFRVDASAEMGLGHVKRCLSLAHALSANGVEVTFVTRPLGVPVPPQVRDEGFGCLMLPTPGGAAPPDPSVTHAAWAQAEATSDARETVQALRGQSVDWVIIDHYSFDARWHRIVQIELGCRIAAIDDLGDRPLAVSVLIDHNHAGSHAAKYAGRIDPSTTILGGPGFALLGPAYAQAPRYEFHPNVRSIGIFMGGADAGNHSSLALRALRKHARFHGPVEIVTTKTNRHLQALEAEAARLAPTTVTIDLPELSGFFARHDLQVGASGGATWERCCIGAPTLAMVVADNQRHVLLPLHALGVLQALQEIPPTVDAMARETVRLIENRQLREGLAARARQLVDGRGAMRVAEHFLHLCNP